MDESKSPLLCLESMLVWIRQRPHMYAILVGELDSVLYFLHMTWAKFAARETDYRSALDAAGQTPMGIVRPEERHICVDASNEVTDRVLVFWAHVDDVLGIQVRVDRWQDTDSPQ